MSEFSVHRCLGHGYCLILDGTRIAGSKPDYRGNNYVTGWDTDETYGPVDELKAENAKLRELVKLMHGTIKDLQIAFDASVVVGGVELSAEYFETEYMRELGIEGGVGDLLQLHRERQIRNVQTCERLDP